jgi:hypothetical protein
VHCLSLTSLALLPTLSVACGDNALLSLALLPTFSVVPTLSVACDDNALSGDIILVSYMVYWDKFMSVKYARAILTRTANNLSGCFARITALLH